jgi:hypothetical protein
MSSGTALVLVSLQTRLDKFVWYSNLLNLWFFLIQLPSLEHCTRGTAVCNDTSVTLTFSLISHLPLIYTTGFLSVLAYHGV